MAIYSGTEGNDTLIGGAAADEVNGFGGNDFLQGGDGADAVLGGAGNDTMSGNAGHDWVRGGEGNDQVTGGGGQDSFAFADFGAANADVLTDFSGGWDNLQLDLNAFTALGSTGRFSSGDGRFRAGTSAQDADDRIIYNQATGQLWYDADGNGAGAAQLIATLSNRGAMSATDIFIFQSATPPAPSGQTINGSAGNDSLTGGAGNDTINGQAGNDTLNGQGGADHYVFGSAAGQENADVVVGFASGSDKIVLDANVLANLGASGNFSADDARFYAAPMSGFWGWPQDATDRIVYDTSTGNLWYDADGSTEATGWAGAFPLLIATLEGAPTLTASDIVVINGSPTGGVSRDGSDGNDSLQGTAADDTLWGGLGDDTLVGFAGNDVLDGGEGQDSMLGGDGNDTLVGGYNHWSEQVVDTMDGGLGNDTYVLGREVYISPWDDTSDQVVLRDAGGIDTVVARSGYWTLGAGFENLELINGYGEGGTLGVGNALNNVMHVDSSWYVWGTLDGGDGNDTLLGGGGRDEFLFQAGSGNYGNDFVDGGADEDTLDFTGARSAVTVDFRTGIATGGGTGGSGRVTFVSIDIATGGDFNDLIIAPDHIVDHRWGDPWGPTFSGAGGNDTLLGGTEVDFLYGDAGDDELRGGGGADVITGGSGSDLMVGDDGDDQFNISVNYWEAEPGPFGSDTVSGGAGIDTLSYGFAGSRVIVDFATGTISGGDEGGGGSVSFSGIERFSGTDWGDQITGNAAANWLDGSGGADTIAGGGGNDTIYGDSWYSGPWTTSQLSGGDGDDQLFAGFGADRLDGGAGSDLLQGSDGRDTLTGGLGRDTLQGGYHDDAFVFDAAPGTANADVIADFDYGGQDAIRLDVRAMATLGPVGTLTAGDGRFYAATDAAGGHDADDRIVYNLTTGELFYDGDGDGAGTAQLIATVQGTPMLFATDFTVYDSGAPSGARIDGTAGNDTLIGSSAADTINGLGGDDYIDGAGGNDRIDGGDGHDRIYSGAGNDTLLGGAGFDTFYLLSGALTSYGQDVIVGGDSSDTLIIDAGASSGIVVDLAAGTLSGGAAASSATISEVEIVHGTQFGDRMTGDGRNNSFVGFDGNDILVGGAGNDTLDANDGNDSLSGGDGNDFLYAADGGVDTLDGGFGDDYFSIDTGDTIADAGGVDTLSVSGSWTLALGYENLIVSSNDESTVLVGTGNAAWNVISVGWAPGGAQLAGLDGNDTLNGSSFADTLLGGNGNDSLSGWGGQDRLDGGGGNDTLDANQGVNTLVFGAAPGAANSDLVLNFNPGFDHIQLDGNAMGAIGPSGTFSTSDARFHAGAAAHDADDRVIYDSSTGNLYYDADGNAAGTAQLIATLQGAPALAASDISVINGSTGLVVNGTGGNDSLAGGPGNDTLNGFGGNDTLDGGAGADTMAGGDGDELYFVDNAADQVVETQNGGIDEVRSSAQSYVLGEWVNNLILVGGAQNGSGNAIENVIVGNAANNQLAGGAGTDTINGEAGNDTLSGGVDADSFLFTVAPGAANADVISDFTSGVDRIRLDGNAMSAIGPSGNFAASDARFWTGSAAHDADDRVIFNSATGQLWYDADGTGAGAAQLIATVSGTIVTTDIAVDNGTAPPPPPPTGTNGTEGNDTIIGTAGSDTINGLGGNDFLQGQGSADTVTGGAGNDTIGGNDGADSLDGGVGNDRVSGGSGQDAFVFREFGAANADTLTDFSGNNWDSMRFDNAAFTALGADGRFVSGDARFRAGTAALDADDRVIYNSGTAQVWYDADGNGAGAAQLIATFQAGATLVASDIWVV